MARMELWQRIRVAREQSGLRQEDIASACGISRNAVTQWESANPDRRTVPTPTNLKILAKLTGRTLDWFLEGDVAAAGRSRVQETSEPYRAGASQFVSDQREIMAAAMKLFHLVRGRSFSPLTADEERRVLDAAADVVLEVGARAILDGGPDEAAYGLVMEKARSGGR